MKIKKNDFEEETIVLNKEEATIIQRAINLLLAIYADVFDPDLGEQLDEAIIDLQWVYDNCMEIE